MVQLLSPSADALLLRCEKCRESISTDVTAVHPLDSNSRLMLPVPEKRSRASVSSKSMILSNMLKRFSLAKSVVGRALKLRGMSKCLPLYFPLIIRIVAVLVGRKEYFLSCSVDSNEKEQWGLCAQYVV